MKIKVIKRDRSLEDFNPQKIKRVVMAAGLDEADAQNLTEKLEAWAHSLGKDKISSLEIRNRVIQELELIDEYTAGLFKWYQKTKDKHNNA